MTDQHTPTPEPTPGPATEPTPEAPTEAWTPPTNEMAAAPAAPLAPAATAAPAVVAVPQPVQPTTATAKSGRGGRLRLVAAAAVVAVVLGATVAVAALLTGATSQASVLRYVPQDTIVYGELRLDLPGDQRQAASAFLSKFPGFADQAALDTKLDEALDQLIGKATDGKQSFTTDIKPWFGGEVAFAVGPLPKNVLSGNASAAADARALLLVSVKDQAAATAWFTDVLSDTGATSTTETYAGTQLTIVTPAGDKAMTAAFAILGGNVAVAGDVTSVKAAVDTNGSQSLASDPNFKTAEASAKGDYFGFAYINTKALAASALAASGSLGTDMPAIGTSVAGLVPDWTAYHLRAESDALVGVATNPHVDGGFGPTTNRVNKVVDHVPSTALVLVAGNDVGATGTGAIAELGKAPSLKDGLDAIDGVAGVFGGVPEALGWIGDAGFVVNQAGSDLEGGLVIVPTDPAKATTFFTTVKSFIALGGASAGLTVRDEAYGDATITIVSVDLGSLGAIAGGLSGGTTDGMKLPDGSLELAFAVTDQVVVIGSSPDFVKHVLDTDAGSSLASDAGFQASVGRVGKDVTGLTFVDIASARTLVEGTMPADERAKYEKDVQPFLEPFDAFGMTTTVGGDLDTTTTVITVK